jgi:hypothetical protein
MAFDHGTLNVPIRKRGDLAAMAQRSVKADAASFEVSVRQSRATARQKFAAAKALIDATSNERMTELGRPHGLTAKQARAQFISAARSNPDQLIQSFSREQGQ